MASGFVLLSWLAVAAGPVGPFSGVTVETLLETPILQERTVAGGAAPRLLKLGRGMTLKPGGGKPAVLTEKGFEIVFRGPLSPGLHAVVVDAVAPSRSTDSYYVELNGRRLPRPLSISTERISRRKVMLQIPRAGNHTVRLSLREGPGSVIRSAQLVALQMNTARPAMRSELVGRHPRLLLTDELIDQLRQRTQNDEVKFFYKMPGPLTRKPPVFRPGRRNGGPYRRLGDYVLSCLLRPDERKRAGILQWLEVATSYPDCGVDLDAEYFMEGVALAYDWFYHQLPDDLRRRVRETIVRQCQRLFEASLAGRAGGGLSFQQNHFWYSHLALALGAAAVYGEEPEATRWLPWAWDRLERIALTFGPDSGFHEGVAYWDFSMPTLYLYIDLYQWCTGLHVPGVDRGLRGQACFRLHHVFPGFDQSVPLEDSRVPQGRPPVKLLLWEARRFQDPVVMGIAKALCSEPAGDRFNLLWLDEHLAARDFRDHVGLAHHYNDIETVFARTSWESDATHVAFVCRPMGGHQYAELCRRCGIGGTGHNHPEQNHFTIFGRGQFLAIDPGYTYEKRTRNHNTILVDGQGQYGDGQMWPEPNPGRAHVTHFASKGDMMIVIGQAASAYPTALGLEQFERTLVLAGRDLVVVRDRLRANKPLSFQWLLHHQGQVHSAGNTCVVTRGTAQLQIKPLLPTVCHVEQSTYRPRFTHPTRDLTPKQPDIGLLEWKTEPTAQTTFLVPLLIGEKGKPLPAVRLSRQPTCDVVTVGTTCVAFNRTAGQMTVPLPWGRTLQTQARTVVARADSGRHQLLAVP